MKSLDLTTETIHLVCDSFSGDSYYVGSAIPARKVANARLAYAVRPTSKVIALIDTTLFGSARTGMAICDDGLYWRNLASDAAGRPWQSFAAAELRLQDNGDLFIGDSRFNTVGGLKGDVCLKLMKALQHLVGNVRTPCEACGTHLSWLDNRANLYAGYESIHRWLKPYHPDYRDTFAWICLSCIDRLNAQVDVIKARLESGIPVTRHEHVHGSRTVRRFERIRHEDRDCPDPGHLEDRLRLYAAQVGANACVEFFWHRGERRTPRTVGAGRSDNGNPYYRTEYDIERWYTGFAVPAHIVPFDHSGGSSVPVQSS